MSGRTRSRRPGPSEVMPQPPETAYEKEMKRKLAEEMAKMSDLTARLHQQNLNNAVLLAEMAARQEGDLVEHFAELGRRFAHLLNQPKLVKSVRDLRSIEGGKS